MDSIDRAIVEATQGGLALCDKPFQAVADAVGVAAEDVMARMEKMREAGMIRRIAAVPNHYALGLRANGMTVWDVDDAEIGRLGPAVGALDFVTHCYRRPRRLPDWPYNLFAMVHGRTEDEVEEKRRRIAAVLGPALRSHDILYSTRILKKTGFRMA